MKVKDLIEQLGHMDAEADVHFAYGYGDHWRTTVAPKVRQVFEGAVEYSEYHRMDKLADKDFEDEEAGNPEENVRRVVIIE
jgi:hypothetical protein